MKEDKAREINRIILWLRQVKQLENLKGFFSWNGNEGKVEQIIDRRCRFLFGTKRSRVTAEYRMDMEEICLFLDFIRERQKHIQKLIDDADQEKVELARMVMNGEIKPEGLTF